MDQFIRNKDNSDAQKSLKLQQAVGEEDFTELTLNNGTTIRGRLSLNGLQGQCEITFPEGSLLQGEFEAGLLQSASTFYAPGINVKASFFSERVTLESFMTKFIAQFPSGYQIEASVSNEGVLKHAVIFDGSGQLVAKSTASQIELDITEAGGQRLLVTKRWIYEGKVSEINDNLSKKSTLCGPGTQLWYTGVGYHQIENVGRLTRKSILRFNRNLELYRETLYSQDQLQKSLTFYGNGLIFFTNQDFFNGYLIFVLPNNHIKWFRCVMEEYWFLKEGTLFLEEAEDRTDKISFKRKDKRVFFYVGNCEYDLAEFKTVLADANFPN